MIKIGTITILPETTLLPISLVGKRAGICYGADITNDEKNYKRGLDCIKSNHGRTLEFVNVEMIIEGYSARVIREWYTHIGGSPTRLQSSTRYIDYKNLKYITPPTINNKEKLHIYNEAIQSVIKGYQSLIGLGVPKEDVANILPLGMETKIVDKRNLRNLVDMSHQRMCTRAYWEYRNLFNDICNALRGYSDEWVWVVDNLFMPKCEYLGKCNEKKSCGRR